VKAKNLKISRAIAAILAAHSAGVAIAQEQEASAGIEEVVVTAQRRSENAQNVPITLTALSGEALDQLGVTNFTDYSKFLTNVTSSSTLPGVGQIYMRGLATTQDGPQSSGTTGAFPNVAVYLDEQSVQLPGRNLDIYAADLERIEVLEGPQGTLFGAGAQAGVVRYITNKPKLNVTEGVFNAGFGTTSKGSNSSNIDATINLPIGEKFALRAVAYNESRGGYIDNVPSTFTRRATDLGIIRYLGGVVPPGSQVISNDRVVDDDINDVTYKGLRVAGRYEFNENWDLLVTQSFQNSQANGVFSQYARGSEGQALPELSVTLFNIGTSKDEFNNTSWTVNGRVGALKMVYTGAFLNRDIFQSADYTNYARGVYADYYQCVLPGTPEAAAIGRTATGLCYSPNSTFQVTQEFEHQSHEFRLNTPEENRWRVIGGVYYEDYQINNNSDWYYRDVQAGFAPLAPPAAATTNNPNPRLPTNAFYNDTQRGYEQIAAFASVDFDILPNLTATVGSRYYEMDTFQVGLNAGSFYCRPLGGLYGANPSIAATGNCVQGNVLDNRPIAPSQRQFTDSDFGLTKTYTGTRSRFNLKWQINDDAMVYGTWSEGFRPGGFNRVGGGAPPSGPLAGVYFTPQGFKPDTLTNTELGWKTQWFDNRLQINGAIYKEKWEDVIVSVFAPGILQNTTFSTNGPTYEVDGGTVDLLARPTEKLSLALSATYNKSELTEAVTFLNAQGQPIDLAAVGLRNPFGLEGDPLALSPKFQASVRARYEFELQDYEAFWQIASAHKGDAVTTTDRLTNDLDGNPAAYPIDSYTTFDLSFGLAKGAWNAQLYVANAGDKRAITFSSYSQWIKSDTIIRPRTITLSFGYKFGE
jgi:iron complex outermembrane receptor protein